MQSAAERLSQPYYVLVPPPRSGGVDDEALADLAMLVIAQKMSEIHARARIVLHTMVVGV
jgi:hypothetical protein